MSFILEYAYSQITSCQSYHLARIMTFVILSKSLIAASPLKSIQAIYPMEISQNDIQT